MQLVNEKELQQAFADSTLAYREDAGKIIPAITREYDLAASVSMMISCTERLIKSSQVHFRLEQRHGTAFLHASKLGESFLMLLYPGAQDVKRYFPCHRIHPNAELFIDAAIARNLFMAGHPIRQHMPLGHQAVPLVDALNGAVEEIRNQGQSTAFKRRLDRFGRLARKNYQGLLRYQRALSAKYARLLVLRLDLGYLKGSFWPSMSDQVGVDYPAVKEHRLRLMRYLNKKLTGQCMVGYALKLEYGLEKGYHYHLMVFLDGAKVREDVTISRLIGENWNADVTEGKGLYFNCNGFKGNYKQCGIGMFHHSDLAMLEGLKKAALYITKTDALIQLVVPDGDRTFWKGIVPGASSNRGRPRTKAVAPPAAEVDH